VGMIVNVQMGLRRLLLSLILIGILGSCGAGGGGGGGVPAPNPPPSPGSEFANPQRVTITGYSQDAMEPFITRDGNFLFFNNSNNPKVDTNLFWAARVDDLHFQFQGEIGGVNTTSLDAVASMDRNHIFYFISPRSYSVTASTIYSGTYSKGAVSGVALVPGVSLAKPGIVDFDNEVSADGATLYFSEGTFDPAGNPRNAKIIIARRVGSGFTPDPNSGTIMKTINIAALDYAADVSAPELEIFFTRLDPGGPAIYRATRSSTSAPFGTPGKITAITGFAGRPASRRMTSHSITTSRTAAACS
jgi:hypothetical protein